ncbi:restriction endonuclease subunit S [Paenibacillus donghaensis]|uniref:restriction endonuclease subunit S n=1 Tax=Paenibacillus donghaensis TaxID=414771 RepID=UPI0012FE30F2|nr:restriction endonuclease subunit S [Paenibacillus donghaensis]
MSRHKENVPKLRFPGFTDAWEQRELGDLAEFSKGSGYTKNDLSETGSPIVLYGRLYTKYETVINDVDTFVEMKDKSVISEGNEVVVPASGETAEDISRASVIGKPGVILGGDLNVIKPNEQIDPVFLALAISNGAPNRDMVKRAQGKSVVHLHNSDLKKINLVFPQIEEQRNILEFNLQLEHLITLHQSKLNKLKNLKAGLLQKILPENGEDFPEVRFPGFTRAWEQRKLGDVIAEAYQGINTASDKVEYSNDGVEILQSKHITSGQISFDDIRYLDKEKYPNYFPKYVPKIDDILFANIGTIGPSVVVKTKKEFLVAWNILKLTLNKNVSSMFIQTSLHKLNNKGHFESVTTGNATKFVNKDEMLRTPISLPSVEEQTKIGTLFNQLDQLITLHQRKLHHLQEQKKALLKQMFI